MQHGATITSRSDLCDINVKLLRQTERAVMVATAFRDCEPVWLPLSQVELSANEDSSGTYALTLPEWLAISKGLV